MKLYNHQQEIIKEDLNHCGFWLGTGSGKTITALSLAKGKTLVVCPKTVRDDRTWFNNLKKIDKELDLTVISKEDFRLGKFYEGYYDTLIIDEAHQVAGVMPDLRWQNRKPIPKTSKIFEKLHTFIKEYKPKRLYLLTATPTRSPMVVWGLSQLLGFDWNFYQFRDAFYFPVKKGFRDIWMIKKDNNTKERLGKAVRKIGKTGKLEDYFDVPNQIYKTVYVEKTKGQVARLKDIEVEFPDPLVLTGKKHQIENGVLKGDEYSESELIKDNKIEAIRDVCYEFKKVVVFAKYIQQIEKIRGELSASFDKVLVLTGQSKDREKIMREANESDSCIIIIQSQISAGFELPSFEAMVFASLSYSVVDKLQAEGRIQRANNIKKNVYITIVTRGGVDEAVYKSINDKVDFNERIYISNQV